MKHIIVLPYYCRKEVSIYLEIACIWKHLAQTKVEYEFLLVARYDMKPSNVLEKEFSKIGQVRSIQCLSKGRGIKEPEKGANIEGPTAMFWETMQYINNNYAKDKGFILWFESDMVPLTCDWLDKLEEEWNSGDYVIMGRLIDKEWVARFMPEWLPYMVEHINGGACYCKDFYEKIPKNNFNMLNSWDKEIFEYIKSHYRYKATDLIELRPYLKTMTCPPEKESVLLHGIKDSSAREYVYKKYDIPHRKL